MSYAAPLAFPDVMARFGDRKIGWFELGLGAYDASTNLRPGIYLGGAGGAEQQLRISAHLGLHFVNGLCCSTVPLFGYRGALDVSRALSDSLSIGLGLAVFDASGNDGDHLVTEEGSARIAFAY